MQSCHDELPTGPGNLNCSSQERTRFFIFAVSINGRRRRSSLRMALLISSGIASITPFPKQATGLLYRNDKKSMKTFLSN